MTSAGDRRRRRRTQTAQHDGKGKGKGYTPSPTKSPTAAPTPKPEVDCTNAADTDGFEFELMWLPGEMRPCAWLLWNAVSTQDRIDRYCDKNDVAANCSISCGICAPPTAPPTKSPTAAPTMSPTSSPSAAPTTASPTMSPTAAPTPCSDDSSFTFEMVNFPGEFRDCAWIILNPLFISYRQARYCGDDDIADACPYACELCPGQDPFPIATKSPTASPTVSPTVCEDDDTFEFEMINYPGEMRDCKWICWRNIEERRANYCGDDEISSSCPAACGLCVP